MIGIKRNIILDGHDIDNRLVVDRDEQLIQTIKWCDSLHDSSGRVLLITGCSGSGKTLLVNGAKKIAERQSNYFARNGINGPVCDFRPLPINIIRCDPENRLRDNAISLLKEKIQFNSAGMSAGVIGVSAGWNILYHQSANDFWNFLQTTYKSSPFAIAFDTSKIDNHRFWDIDIKHLVEEANSRGIKLNIIVVTTTVSETQEGIIRNSDKIHLNTINRDLIEKYIFELCERHNIDIPNYISIIDEYLISGDFRYLNKSLNAEYLRRNSSGEAAL